MFLLVVLATLRLGSIPGDDAARQEAIATARAALAQKQGLMDEDVVAEDAIPREWPDSSLGCAEKDRVYLPVATRGYRVVLRVGKTVHVVHVADGHAVFCKSPLAAAPGQPQAAEDALEAIAPEPELPAQKALVTQAREDLARRLSISPADVSLVKYKEVVWPDRGLGCPRPGVAYPQVPQDGVAIVFHAAGRRYDYHAGAGRAPFLCTNPETSGVR